MLNLPHKISIMKFQKKIILMTGLLIATFCVVFVVKSYYLPLAKGENRYTDFLVYYKAGLRFNTNNLTLYNPVRKEDAVENGTFNYPPMTMLIFSPVSFLPYPLAYGLFSLLSLLSSIGIVFVFLRIKKEIFNIQIHRQNQIYIIVMAMSFTPIWQDVKHGQINAIVCFSAMLFIFLILKRKIFWALVLLTVGFWLKIYTILLLFLIIPFALHRSEIGRTYGVYTSVLKIIYYTISILAVPLIVFTYFIPLDLYRYYFLEYMPHLTNMTNLSGFNQSLYGIGMRLLLNIHDFSTWEFVEINTLLKIFGSLLTVVIVTITTKRMYKTDLKNWLLHGYIFLATLPLISQYGWEYVYVFSFPLFLEVVYQMFTTESIKLRQFVLYCIVYVLFWIPKPSDATITTLTASINSFVVYLFFARWFIAVILLIFLAKTVTVNKLSVQVPQ